MRISSLISVVLASCSPCPAEFPKHQVRPVKPPAPSGATVWSFRPGSGWASGVVIPSPNSDTFLTARHLSTPVGMKVFVNLGDGSQFVTTVISKRSPDIQVEKSTKLAKEPKLDRWWYGDVTICKVDPPFPIKAPGIGDIASGRVTAIHKDGSAAEHSIAPAGQNWLKAQWSRSGFLPGDSGLPWFHYSKARNEWLLVGITSRVAITRLTPHAAESPRLGSKAFAPVIK